MNPFEQHWDDPCIDEAAISDPDHEDYPFTLEDVGVGPGGKALINLVLNPTPGMAICGEISLNDSDFKINNVDQIDKNSQKIDSIELAEGHHHFKSSDGTTQNFNMNAGGDVPVSGENVTVLVSNVQLDWLGGSDLSLSAPSDFTVGGGIPDNGFLASDLSEGYGHVIHQNPAVYDPVLEHELGGTNGASIDGLIYTGLHSHFNFHGDQNTSEDDDACLTAIAGIIWV